MVSVKLTTLVGKARDAHRDLNLSVSSQLKHSTDTEGLWARMGRDITISDTYDFEILKAGGGITCPPRSLYLSSGTSPRRHSLHLLVRECGRHSIRDGIRLCGPFGERIGCRRSSDFVHFRDDSAAKRDSISQCSLCKDLQRLGSPYSTRRHSGTGNKQLHGSVADKHVGRCSDVLNHCTEGDVIHESDSLSKHCVPSIYYKRSVRELHSGRSDQSLPLRRNDRNGNAPVRRRLGIHNQRKDRSVVGEWTDWHTDDRSGSESDLNSGSYRNDSSEQVCEDSNRQYDGYANLHVSRSAGGVASEQLAFSGGVTPART